MDRRAHEDPLGSKHSIASCMVYQCLYESRAGRDESVGYNHQSTLAALNRQVSSDEKARTGGGSPRVFIFPRPGCYRSRLLAGIDDPSGIRAPDSLFIGSLALHHAVQHRKGFYGNWPALTLDV